MEETPQIEPVTPVPRKARQSRKLAMSLVALLFLASGTGGAWWWMRIAAAAPEVTETPLSERGLVTFDPFLVNLADAGGSRFLKINIELVVNTAAAAEAVQKAPVVLMPVRSA